LEISGNGSSHERDVTIIGAGPTGLFTGYYCGFRGLSVRIVDVLHELGGQVTAYYPEKMIYDVPGFAAILGKDLVKALAEQVAQYNPEYCLGEEIRSLEKLGEKQFKLTTASGKEYMSKAVIITSGVGLFEPNKLPDPRFRRYEGKGLYYAVKSRADFEGKDLLVIGGGDSAVDWALNLEGTAKSIILIHRRDGFRAAPDSMRKLAASSVEVRAFTELEDIKGTDWITDVRLKDTKTTRMEMVARNAVLACLGFISRPGPMIKWPVEFEKGQIRVDERYETAVPGVFAAGDVAYRPGKIVLIATGYGEGCTAANYAAHYIKPGESVMPEHSTSREQA
jgi:thioredoxin reductase (NADPH)